MVVLFLSKWLHVALMRELVRGLVRLTQEAQSYNLAIYFSSQIASDIKGVFHRLNEIKGIGPKIASFIIRDFAWIFNLEEKIPDQHKRYLQPVDIWLGRTALCLWPDLVERYWPIAEKLADECNRVGICGIEFNQGAWYFGAQEVRDFDSLCDELSKL